MVHDGGKENGGHDWVEGMARGIVEGEEGTKGVDDDVERKREKKNTGRKR